MDTNIYYNPQEKGLFITSNFAERQKRMDLGIHPKIDYRKISISDLDNYIFDGITFDKVEDDYFQSIKEIFSKYKFNYIALYSTNVALLDVVLNVRHLILGDGSLIDLSPKSFKNLKEITFLSVKTFKGEILDKIESVEKLILWYEHNKSNEIVSKFPNLKEFQINNGSITELDMTTNPLLESLRLHRCLKLEKVVLNPSANLKTVIVEACKKLDVSNLGDDVRRW